MAMTGRNRDFTSETLNGIRKNFDTNATPYNELSRWWADYGEAFDFADPTEEIQYLEKYMCELREFMSVTAPNALNTIETNVRQLDADYAAQVNEIDERLKKYGRVVEVLVAAIRDPAFETNFDKNKTLERMYLVDPDLKARRAERRNFIKTTMEQYGFDYETAEILWKVWLAIKASNPNDTPQMLDWKYTRAISQLVYNEGDKLPGQWSAGAGSLYGYSEEETIEYFRNLGLTEEQARLLYYKVRIQNAIVGSPETFSPEKLREHRDSQDEKKVEQYNSWKAHMEKGLGRSLTDDEFEKLWEEQYEGFCIKRPDGTYQGKADYAHMMYTIAGGCVDDNAEGVEKRYPNPIVAIVSGTFWDDHDTRKQYIGWLGDATFDGGDGTSFGPDDYAADLDADNIRRRMEKENISYIQASTDYYADMAKSPILRVKEFNKNNPYEDVEKAVLDAAGVSSLKDLDEKKGWDDTYDFLMSLKYYHPTMQHYRDGELSFPKGGGQQDAPNKKS